MTIKKNLYISGPISGYDIDERREVFQKAESRLKSIGYATFNPLRNGLPDSASYEEHMAVDLDNLMQCDAIFMLDGWALSKGCRREYHLARKLGMTILYEGCDMMSMVSPSHIVKF